MQLWIFMLCLSVLHIQTNHRVINNSLHLGLQTSQQLNNKNDSPFLPGSQKKKKKKRLPAWSVGLAAAFSCVYVIYSCLYVLEREYLMYLRRNRRKAKLKKSISEGLWIFFSRRGICRSYCAPVKGYLLLLSLLWWPPVIAFLKQWTWVVLSSQGWKSSQKLRLFTADVLPISI